MVNKGEKTEQKCKKCGTFMIAATAPFLATIFGKQKRKVMSQFTKCPKCGKRGILRLE
jgi:predicted RNA-binding Zn-ribbon protein involved in translation (DUF1610 family)